MRNRILEIIGLTREFKLGDSTIKAVNNVSLSLDRGEILGIVPGS